jgi:hypothetical protein
MPKLRMGREAHLHGACDKAVPQVQEHQYKEAEKGKVILMRR